MSEELDVKVEDRGDAVREAGDAAQETGVGKEDAAAQEAEDGKREAGETGQEVGLPGTKKHTGKGIIPVERHEAVLGRERAAREAAEARLAAMEHEQRTTLRQNEVAAAVAELDQRIDALAGQHTRAIMEGDEAGAVALRREISKLDRQIARLEISGDSEQQASNMIEANRVEQAVAQLEATYPAFNPASEEYDEALTAFAISEQQRLMRSESLPAAKALLRAAESIAARFLAPAPAEVDPARRGLAAGSERKQAAVARNLEVAARQAPSMRDLGQDSDKRGAGSGPDDVARMGEKEFSELPEATLKRLRGDFL